MKKFTVLFACVTLLMTFGCSNPKGQRLTEKNKESFLKEFQNSKPLSETFLQEIQGFKNLPKDDADLLNRYVSRHVLMEKLRGDAEKEIPLVGKTVGEIIELQRQWDKEKAEEEALQKKLAEEAKAKEEAILTELRKTLTLTVFKKGFLPTNYDISRYQEYISFSVTYQNNSQKDIRAFQGTVAFKDLFGDLVKNLNIKITNPIKAGGKANWDGVMDYNQFIDSDVRLRNAELKNLKVDWIPEKIIFADGTTIPKDDSNK